MNRPQRHFTSGVLSSNWMFADNKFVPLSVWKPEGGTSHMTFNWSDFINNMKHRHELVHFIKHWYNKAFVERGIADVTPIRLYLKGEKFNFRSPHLLMRTVVNIFSLSCLYRLFRYPQVHKFTNNSHNLISFCSPAHLHLKQQQYATSKWIQYLFLRFHILNER
jgi:hypothetical protein